MSNPDATKDVNEVPTVRTRKQIEKGLTYSLEIVFDRRKRLLLRLQRKSENIKNLMEIKFNVRTVFKEFKQYNDLLKLFSGVQDKYHGKLDDDCGKLIIFGLMKLIKKSSPLSILSIIICNKSRNSGKTIKEHVINEKMILTELEALASFRKQQKANKLAVEEMKLEEELVKAKARVNVIEAQEELEKGKTLSSSLNSGHQFEFTKNLSFMGRIANNMPIINQNMNVL